MHIGPFAQKFVPRHISEHLGTTLITSPARFGSNYSQSCRSLGFVNRPEMLFLHHRSLQCQGICSNLPRHTSKGLVSKAPFTGKQSMNTFIYSKYISLVPGNALGNGVKVMTETQCQPLGLSKHDHLKGMDGTLTFSNRTLLTYQKENDSPGWAICPSKICELFLAEISTVEIISHVMPLNNPLCKVLCSRDFCDSRVGSPVVVSIAQTAKYVVFQTRISKIRTDHDTF